jgi:3D (Asp-Asp-Asp) domain-containing protein
MDILEQILEFFVDIMGHRPLTSDSVLSSAPEKNVAAAPLSAKKPDTAQLRSWRLTQYYVAAQREHVDAQTVPVYRYDGIVAGLASPAFFSSLSLEGTGIMGNGKLMNVNGTYIPVKAEQYQPVWDYHKKYLSHRDPGYSGLVIENDKVVKAFSFREITPDAIGKGFGTANKIPMDPYRTLAADLGRTSKDDPRYRGKGGLVPVGTRVYIKELDGVSLPDGSIHDGWCIVNDTGGGIFGAHFDVFIGYSSNEKKTHIPEQAHIWFDGIENKISTDYSLGLHDV